MVKPRRLSAGDGGVARPIRAPRSSMPRGREVRRRGAPGSGSATGIAGLGPAVELAAGRASGSRCPSASKRSTDPATAALSDPIAPRIGIRTIRSQRRRTVGERPWPSLPTTIARGPRRSACRAVSGASASEPRPGSRERGDPSARPRGRQRGRAGDVPSRRPTP